MAAPLLSTRNLAVERGGRLVLSGLTLALAPGAVLLVTGRNGAGKSTLLRTLAGLLPASAGTIGYGLATDEVRGVETLHYLGYEDALKPTLTVEENLGFWAAMLGAGSSPAQRGRGTTRSVVEGGRPPPSPDREAPAPPPPPAAVPLPRFTGEDHTTTAALAAFGIGRLAPLPAAYLSAGQKRRVALARLLLAHRPVWLLDEPLIALDTAAQATLTGLMAAHAAAGGAILVASHQPLALPHKTLDLVSGMETPASPAER